MCFSQSDNSAAEAERARQEEARRLEALKRAEEARILKETLESKRSQAERENASAAAQKQFYSRGATSALEDPDKKSKSLLSNYAN